MCLKLSICLSALLDQGQDAYYSAEPFLGKPVYAIQLLTLCSSWQ